ncbi:hypothetical protein [Frigoribacterium salinisoli]
MSTTLLEDVEVWGLLPREITYLAAQLTGLATAGSGFAGYYFPLWFLLLAAAAGAVASIYLLRLTKHLRKLGYSAVPSDDGRDTTTGLGERSATGTTSAPDGQEEAMDSEGSAPSRSGSPLRRVVVVGGILLALVAAGGTGSRVIGPPRRDRT